MGYISKIGFLLNLTVFSLMSSVLCGQDSESTDSLELQSKEVQTIYKDAASNPLRSIETSSPRATLKSFIENMYRAHRILMLAYNENKLISGFATPDSILLKSMEAEEFFQMSVRCLDLSEIPESYKENIGNSRTLKLKEILDRVELPPFPEVPGNNDLEIVKKDSTVSKLLYWRIPHTDIVLERVEEGPRKNEFLFSEETVRRLDDFYYKIKDLPYKSDTLTTQGFYDFLNSTPGKFLPPKWSKWLPEWSYSFFLEQTIWQWMFLVIYSTISAVIIFLAYRWLNPWNLALSPIMKYSKRISFLILILAILLCLFLLDSSQINMTGLVKIILTIPGSMFFWFLTAVLFLFIFKVSAEIIINSPKINPADIQASYIRALFTVIGFIVAIITFIFGLSRAGVSLGPLLTGVGIGGLAIAIAARPTLENIIGSFMISADKPFKTGQRIQVAGYDGIVEEIGLRSTKIRLLNGNLTSIPNEKMVTLEIENIEQRPYIRRVFNINITYDTPPEKILKAIKILNDILSVPEKPDAETGSPYETFSVSGGRNHAVNDSHPNEAINKPEFPPRIYFNDFNSDSLNIYVSYWYHPPEFWEYLEHANWVNIRIKERFNAEGIEFAFPTQTIHFSDEVKNQNKIYNGTKNKKNTITGPKKKS